MLRRTSTHRRSADSSVALNLVPIIDTMVTLIGFLLFTTSFFALVSIESPFPQVSARDVEEKLHEKPLQLTLTLRERETEIWSPFNRIAPIKIPHEASGSPQLKPIHDALLGIKQRFPLETKVVLVPAATSTYDALIQVMDVTRLLDKTDPPIYAKNAKTGLDESVKSLFPEIIFGNLLGGA